MNTRQTTISSWRDKSTFESPVFNACWVLNAPWAHPLWSQYVIFLYDLTVPMPDKEPSVLLKPGMTHELLLYALDPSIVAVPEKTFQDSGLKLLTPANYGYQFAAESDEAAVERICKVIDKIVSKQLSPDTDFRDMWDVLFQDGASLRR